MATHSYLNMLIAGIFKQNTIFGRELPYCVCLCIKHFVHLIEFNILNVHFDSLCLYLCSELQGSLFLWELSAFQWMPFLFCLGYSVSSCSTAAFFQIVFFTWNFILIKLFAHFFSPLEGVWINLFPFCLPSSNF